MAFLTALLAGIGGYGQGQQQKVQNQLAQQQEADYQAQTALEKQRTQQEQERFNVEQEQAGYDPVTGKLLPLTATGYIPIKPGDDEATISKKAWQNYAIATQQGDNAGMARWGGFVGKGSPSQAYQQVAAGGMDIAHGNLYQAQVDYWKNWRTRLKMQYDNALRRVGAQQAGAMQRAYLSAGTRAEIANRSLEERDAIAVQAALNLAQYHSEDQAYRAAVDQANRQDILIDEQYKAQAAAAAKAGQPVPQIPMLPPINVQVGTPGYTINLVDPRTGQVTTRTVKGTNNTALPKRTPIAQFIQEGRAHGVNDPAQLRKAAHDAGYSDAEITRALMPNVNFNPPQYRGPGSGPLNLLSPP